MNNNLFKKFIVQTSNFFLKRKENIKAEKVIFVDAMPLGGTGKILKKDLRDQYNAVLLEA